MDKTEGTVTSPATGESLDRRKFLAAATGLASDQDVADIIAAVRKVYPVIMKA